MVIKDMIQPPDLTSKLNTSSASVLMERKELIRVTKRRQIEDMRMETGAMTANVKEERRALMLRGGAVMFIK